MLRNVSGGIGSKALPGFLGPGNSCLAVRELGAHRADWAGGREVPWLGKEANTYRVGTGEQGRPQPG